MPHRCISAYSIALHPALYTLRRQNARTAILLLPLMLFVWAYLRWGCNKLNCIEGSRFFRLASTLVAIAADRVKLINLLARQYCKLNQPVYNIGSTVVASSPLTFHPMPTAIRVHIDDSGVGTHSTSLAQGIYTFRTWLLKHCFDDPGFLMRMCPMLRLNLRDLRWPATNS